MTVEVPSPLITLLTDFGTRDVYAGVMRGVISNLAPQARIVDLTHEVSPQAVTDAAFLLDSAAPYFPWGTIHVAVVDPGVGTERRILCVRTSRATYLAPDNGLLARVLERETAARIVSVENRQFFLQQVSSTFHGRDIFAPVAAHLALGIDPCRLGPEIEEIKPLDLPRCVTNDSEHISGEIIYVDHFGNLVTNVPLVSVLEVVDVTLGGVRIHGPVRRCYAERERGALLLLAGSSGLLEVAVNQGSARDRLCVRRGAALEITTRRAERSETP